MPRLIQRVPGYCLHKHSGQAIVTLSGFDHYLGPYGSEDSRRLYDRLIAEWLSAGRHFAKPTAEPVVVGVTVDEVVLAFWRHAESYYISPVDGKPTSELPHFRYALRHLRRPTSLVLTSSPPFVKRCSRAVGVANTSISRSVGW